MVWTHGSSIHNTSAPFSSLPSEIFDVDDPNKFLFSPIVPSNFDKQVIGLDLVFELKSDNNICDTLQEL